MTDAVGGAEVNSASVELVARMSAHVCEAHK